MNAPKPDAQDDSYIKSIVETRRELMLLKYMKHPHIGPAHFYELTVVLRLQELEDEQAHKSLCPNIPILTTPL